jgi:hypothetical protein
MAKLSDLPDADAPLPTEGLRKPVDAGRFIQRCKVMELDPMYTFAYDTIAGIRCMVESTGTVTVGQERAIANIQAGAQRTEDARYEERSRKRYKRRWERE